MCQLGSSLSSACISLSFTICLSVCLSNPFLLSSSGVKRLKSNRVQSRSLGIVINRFTLSWTHWIYLTRKSGVCLVNKNRLGKDFRLSLRRTGMGIANEARSNMYSPRGFYIRLLHPSLITETQKITWACVWVCACIHACVCMKLTFPIYRIRCLPLMLTVLFSCVYCRNSYQ